MGNKAGASVLDRVPRQAQVSINTGAPQFSSGAWVGTKNGDLLGLMSPWEPTDCVAQWVRAQA